MKIVNEHPRLFRFLAKTWSFLECVVISAQIILILGCLMDIIRFG